MDQGIEASSTTPVQIELGNTVTPSLFSASIINVLDTKDATQPVDFQSLVLQVFPEVGCRSEFEGMFNEPFLFFVLNHSPETRKC